MQACAAFTLQARWLVHGPGLLLSYYCIRCELVGARTRFSAGLPRPISAMPPASLDHTPSTTHLGNVIRRDEHDLR